MRLLCAKTRTLHEFVGDAIPPYATLSHTWEIDEITFQDITNGHSYRESKKGWAKVIKCCQQAVEDALEFVWIDTCCIDKSNSTELQEAINSMFKWYEMSIECYVYISDFSHPGLNADPQEKQSALQDYMRARWFTRGWTLQELLAPPSVRFFDSTWLEFGDKISLREQISEATGISQEVLVDSVIDIHWAMDSNSIAQRMSWASRRTTTKEEDIAYCLLGIFDVNMPLLYGEGPKAFQRLQEEIMKRLDDQSILAWGISLKDSTLGSVSTALARSPRNFHNCGGIASRGAAAPGDGFSMSQRGLRLDMPVFGDFGNGDILYCILNCTMVATGSKIVTPRLLAVPLARCLSRADGAKPKPDEYYWLCNRIPHWIGENEVVASKRKTIYIPCFYRHGDLIRPRLDCNLDFGPLPPGYFIAGMFPPERSTDSLLNLALHNQQDTSYVIVHIATNLQQPGHLVVMKGKSHSKDSTMISDPLYFNKRLSLPLNNAKLREIIIESLAATLRLETSKINSGSSLLELGLDSLSAIEFFYRLEELTGTDISIHIFELSKTIKDVENKLRFATRSYFREIANDQKRQFEIPLFTIDSPQFAMVEVAPNASLIDLLSRADFLETAKYTDDTSEAILQMSKSLQLKIHNQKPSKMKTAQDFPRFKLCDPCSRLLTEYRDEANPDPNSIRYHMWYEARGYEYCRTRRELEQAAVFGCVFCKAVASRDRRYHQQDEDDSNGSDDPEDETGLLFEERRPAWYPPLDEELGLSIRYQWVDNVLWIWSRSGIEWSGGDLSWAMYATPDDPAASVVHAQALLQDLESPESFAEARVWMDECLANHGECPAHLPADLPTRLIEVSRLGEPEFARLCETSGQKGHYCALSYCWGGDQVLKTLRERYGRYQKELPYDQLPQTIKDAFQVTRNMGLKYIWIDDFCIIQDSDEDKQAEMAKMMSIYQKTQFTISVASASAATQGFLQTDYHDPGIGAFYHPLRVQEDIMGSVIISEDSSSFASVSAHKQPINTRGWTLQEALLTPRLLIFTNMHMVWKCQTGYQPDFHATSRDSRERREEDSPWRFWSMLCGYSFTPLKELDELAGPEIPQTGKAFNALGGTYTTWHYILNMYSTRHLTVESDRLPAISAIAQAFAAHFKTEYYAGLWGRFLVHDLMWENWLSDPNATKSGAPSWSWATLKGELHYDRGNTDYARAEVVSCKTTPVSDKNPFGAVTGGELVIRGHVNKLWLIGGEPFARKLFDDKDKAISDAEFISDGGLEDWNGRRIAVLCLVLGDKPGSVMHRDYPSCCPNYITRCPESTRCRMMVLVESLDREGCYERIGLAKAETYKRPCWWEKCEKMTVTVI